ncbi:MAG: hypothetical protein ACREA2_09815 [Blastocatellia bacterium]
MRRRTFFFSLISLCLAAPVTAFGQKGCESDGTTGRYFLVLAGRSGTFYDNGGPAFPMLIKLDGERMQVDALGIYSIQGKRMFGPVPEETYREFMKEPSAASDVMLRLEITSAQYARGLKILRTWERRVKEGALLYPDVSMDNILLVKEVAESLNKCGEKEIKLYKLDWGYEDKISDNNPPPQVPFLFFKEMKRLNESLHMRDEKFQEYRNAAARPARQ